MQSDLISRSKLHKSIQREEPVIIDGWAYIRRSAVLEKISMAPGVEAAGNALSPAAAGALPEGEPQRKEDGP